MTEPNDRPFPFLMPDAYEYQRRTATIELFQETIFLTRYNDDGSIAKTIEVDPASLVSAFSGQPITTGPLPMGTIYYSTTGGIETIAVFVPPAVRTLFVKIGRQRTPYRIPLPPLLFVGRNPFYRVFAVRQYPGEDDRLYHAPLPNVSLEGTICQGNAEFPRAGRRTIRDAIKTFFRSNFNDHMNGGKSQAHDGALAVWDRLNHCSILYPMEDLIPSRFTLRELIMEAQ